MTRYVVVVGDPETTHFLIPGWVMPWLFGLLAGISQQDPEVAKTVERKIREIPEDSPTPQRCFLALTICHDHGVIRYQGVSRG